MQFKYKYRASTSSLYTSLWLQTSCTCSLPTPHIFSIPNRRCIWNPVEHLWWSFLAETVNVFRPLVFFAENLHRGYLTGCLTGF